MGLTLYRRAIISPRSIYMYWNSICMATLVQNMKQLRHNYDYNI